MFNSIPSVYCRVVVVQRLVSQHNKESIPAVKIRRRRIRNTKELLFWHRATDRSQVDQTRKEA